MMTRSKTLADNSSPTQSPLSMYMDKIAKYVNEYDDLINHIDQHTFVSFHNKEVQIRTNAKPYMNRIHEILKENTPQRGAILGKNPPEVAAKYPKVNPQTRVRLYERGYYWMLAEDYTRHPVKCNRFEMMDIEYADMFETMPNGKSYKIYDYDNRNHYDEGWSRPGFYWATRKYGVRYSKYDITIQTRIPNYIYVPVCTDM
jgi:hypothetical protein